MTRSALDRYLNTPRRTEEEIARDTIIRCGIGLQRQLEGLTAANKNRVLLALHAQIGDELETLAETHNN